MLKEAFWTVFGQKMAENLSAEGIPVKWVNYKTGIRHLYFRMDADKNRAIIAIEMTSPDMGIQELLYQNFLAHRAILESYIDASEWIWESGVYNESGYRISRIYTTLEGVNVLKKEDQAPIYRFLKKRIITLDAFWSDAKPGFEMFI